MSCRSAPAPCAPPPPRAPSPTAAPLPSPPQAQLAACAKALESSEELLEAANQALGTADHHDFAQVGPHRWGGRPCPAAPHAGGGPDPPCRPVSATPGLRSPWAEAPSFSRRWAPGRRWAGCACCGAGWEHGDPRQGHPQLPAARFVPRPRGTGGSSRRGGCCAVGYRRGGAETLGVAEGARARSAPLAPARGSGHAVTRWLLALLSHLLVFFFLLFPSALTRLPNRSRIGTAPPGPPGPPSSQPGPRGGWPQGCGGGSAHPPHGRAGQGVTGRAGRVSGSLPP